MSFDQLWTRRSCHLRCKVWHWLYQLLCPILPYITSKVGMFCQFLAPTYLSRVQILHVKYRLAKWARFHWLDKHLPRRYHLSRLIWLHLLIDADRQLIARELYSLRMCLKTREAFLNRRRNTTLQWRLALICCRLQATQFLDLHLLLCGTPSKNFVFLLLIFYACLAQLKEEHKE